MINFIHFDKLYTTISFTITQPHAALDSYRNQTHLQISCTGFYKMDIVSLPRRRSIGERQSLRDFLGKGIGCAANGRRKRWDVHGGRATADAAGEAAIVLNFLFASWRIRRAAEQARVRSGRLIVFPPPRPLSRAFMSFEGPHGACSGA